MSDETKTPRFSSGLILAAGAPLLGAVGILILVTPSALRKPAAGPAQPAAAAAAAPAPAAQFYPAPFRSDWVEIPLAAKGDAHHGDELEYKVRMNAGESLVYGWTVQGAARPEEFYADFHGESPPPAGATEPKVIEYRQAVGLSANGGLVAPVAGIHGWYLQNRSPAPVLVKLKLSGFYQLIPSGEDGNEGGIEANTPGGYPKA